MKYFVAAHQHVMFHKFHFCTWHYTFWNLHMLLNLNLQALTDLNDQYCQQIIF